MPFVFFLSRLRLIYFLSSLFFTFITFPDLSFSFSSPQLSYFLCSSLHFVHLTSLSLFSLSSLFSSFSLAFLSLNRFVILSFLYLFHFFLLILVFLPPFFHWISPSFYLLSPLFFLSSSDSYPARPFVYFALLSYSPFLTFLNLHSCPLLIPPFEIPVVYKGQLGYAKRRVNTTTYITTLSGTRGSTS